MARPKSDVTISLKGRSGITFRLNLTRLPDGKWLVYRDGKKSDRLPHATSTQVADVLRAWLANQATLAAQ